MTCACGVQCERPCNAEPGSVCDDCQCRCDDEHRAELEALRRSYEDANARGGEANERLQRQLREAKDANVMSAALIERLRGELAEARGFILTLAERNNCGEIDCGDPDCDGCVARKFIAATPPAESTPVQFTQKDADALAEVMDDAAPPDDIRARPTVVYVTQGQLDQRMRVVSERLDALEAKDEPGTHAFVDNCNVGNGLCYRWLDGVLCGKRIDDQCHPKGAKP